MQRRGPQSNTSVNHGGSDLSYLNICELRHMEVDKTAKREGGRVMEDPSFQSLLICALFTKVMDGFLHSSPGVLSAKYVAMWDLSFLPLQEVVFYSTTEASW